MLKEKWIPKEMRMKSRAQQEWETRGSYAGHRWQVQWIQIVNKVNLKKREKRKW